MTSVKEQDFQTGSLTPQNLRSFPPLFGGRPNTGGTAEETRRDGMGVTCHAVSRRLMTRRGSSLGH